MSVFNINSKTILEDDFSQFLDYNPELKELYGEINTPFFFINKMLSIIPYEHFTIKTNKWLDAGAGHGNYSLCLFFILFKSLKDSIPNDKKRIEHIIENMIYMVEFNKDNIPFLREKFGKKANIIEINYLDWEPDFQFDFIIGNPPYNFNGLKKVPTKNNVNKKDDGKTIWCEFVKHNLSLLKSNGIMNVLIPSIWMKPDKAGMYELLLKYDISKLHTLNANETNKTFGFHVQTPTCYFLLTKRENNGYIELYDSLINNYFTFSLEKDLGIPLNFSSIVDKVIKLKNIYGKLNVIKTNLPSSTIKVFDVKSPYTEFANIHTTTLDKEKNPCLTIKYTCTALPFYGESKIVMGHKMYGFPYLDLNGEYGISNRDNYIIKNKSDEELKLIKEFLSNEFILFLFETTRYRMRYLEKYVFDYIPDFSKIDKAREMFQNNNIDIYTLFNISDYEKTVIQNYFKYKYKFFN